MSEYQYYEFVAIDRPLTGPEQKALRRISTRADISATRFVNEYHFGDLKADPAKLVEKYFDAAVYVTNWGTRQLLLRLPRTRDLGVRALQAYQCQGDSAGLAVKAGRSPVLLDFLGGDEAGDDEGLSEATRALSSLVELRREIQAGDFRGLYLAWLRGVQAFGGAEEDLEPPVPAGLKKLSGAQKTLVEFLCLDPELLRAAASVSQSTAGTGASASPKALRSWITMLPIKEKDRMLLAVAQGKDPGLRARFAAEQAKGVKEKATPSRIAMERRTVRQLLEAAGLDGE